MFARELLMYVVDLLQSLLKLYIFITEIHLLYLAVGEGWSLSLRYQFSLFKFHDFQPNVSFH